MIYNSEIYAQIMNQNINDKHKIIVRKTGKKLVLKKTKKIEDLILQLIIYMVC